MAAKLWRLYGQGRDATRSHRVAKVIAESGPAASVLPYGIT